MATASESVVTWGNTTVQGCYEPWPQYWTWPTTYIYTTPVAAQADQDYANEVEIERGEHDATLHFYRSSGPGKGKTFIKTITIPLGVLEWMTRRTTDGRRDP